MRYIFNIKSSVEFSFSHFLQPLNLILIEDTMKSDLETEDEYKSS